MPPTVRLKKHEQRRILQGHLWVFSNEVAEVDAEAENGSIVRLEDAAHNVLGMGFYNKNSLIAVRLFSRKDEVIDRAFFERRLLDAAQLRNTVFPESTAYRLAHGESDLLPGLIIDRYNDSFVVQMLSAGMQTIQPMLVEILCETFKARTVFARNDSALRALEGLDAASVTLFGDATPEVITDGMLDFEVDVVAGQKTGFFYDQRLNRMAIRPFCKGARVLDCHTNIGGFALHAASAGAAEVIGVDSSATALEAAARNAERNGLEEVCSWINGDSMKTLKSFVDKREQFDIVVLDPPAYAKNKKTLSTALNAYVELQTLGLLLVKKGGILATSSCSHHVSSAVFDEVINAAAVKTHRYLQIIERRGAAPDHPVLAGMDETEYLKFRLCRIL